MDMSSWEHPLEAAMLILLLPITTICVALLGFYVWHRQLTRKRHFDIADAALAAFSRAEAALTYARHPASYVHEGKSRKREPAELPADSELLDALFVPVERLKQHEEAFDELERVAFAVEIHLGEAIAHQLREPLRAYNRIITATTCRMELLGMSGAVYDRLRWRLEAFVRADGQHGDFAHGDSPTGDHMVVQLESAKADVETALRPYLVAPTFDEFLRVQWLLALTRRRLARLLALKERSHRAGHDMIPVYRQSPLGSDRQLPEPQ
jgi:hypothetical protein